MSGAPHTVIIGAGIGGLAMANILAKTGQQVTIYEKNTQPGGRAGLLERDGFRFDTGPSWYLMPEIFEHYFELIGEDITKYLDLVRLDPGYQVFFEHNDSVLIHGDMARDSQTFESREKGSAKRLASYLQSAEVTYELAKKYFLYNNFSDPWNMLGVDTMRAAPKMFGALTRSMDGNVSHYVADQSLKQILEYPAVFLGSSPYKAPAIYSLMSHLDFKQGVFYPMGGIYTLIQALVRIGQKLGVRYHFNAPVERILTEGSRATGVMLEDGETVAADRVISNADLHFTETKLLPEKLSSYPQRYWEQATPGPSALLIYLGIKGPLPSMQHHNLFFSSDWKRGFSAVFDQQRWPDPASLYVCVPSRTDASVAPKGHENMFVLVPGPADLNISAGALEKLADGYIAQIATMAHIPDLPARIVSKTLYGPNAFYSQLHAWQGTALGMSHILKQSAFFRPQNKSKKVDNLYYVGAGTVPGIGLPMCLISAETLYKRFLGDNNSGRLMHLKDEF